ncbi:MAG: hypothetical protein M3313_05260, partial [Actinomycetota bacterium]|nr:hypothetical protein [Actinomycetota bacterium]
PVPADYNGDVGPTWAFSCRACGICAPGWEPGRYQVATAYGLPTNFPVPGDWNGDGRAGLGGSRPVRL